MDITNNSLADWNMAKATMMRMDAIMKNAYNAYKMNDGIVLYKEIISLHKEVAPELKDTERDECLRMINLCTTEFNRLVVMREKNPALTMTSSLLKNLNDLELYVRCCMGKHELLLPHKDDPRNLGRRARY